MIINITKSTLFTVTPDTRFSDKYDVPRGIWNTMYSRYQLLGYTVQDVRDLYELKTGKQISTKSVQRWIWRSEVYSQAKVALDKGAEHVVSNYFGDKEAEVIRELLKHIKGGVSKNVRSLP